MQIKSSFKNVLIKDQKSIMIPVDMPKEKKKKSINFIFFTNLHYFDNSRMFRDRNLSASYNIETPTKKGK